MHLEIFKRIFSKTYFNHALAFARAGRRLLFVPVLMQALTVFFMRVVESLKDQANITVNDASSALPALVILTTFLVAAGICAIVSMVLSIWRLCILARAYLLTPYESSSVDRVQVFEKTIKEAEFTLSANKGKLAIKLLCISLLQIPPFFLFVLGAVLATFALPQTVEMLKATYSPEYLEPIQKLSYAGLIMVPVSAVVLNVMTVAGGAKALEPHLKLSESVVGALKLSVTHSLVITVISIPVYILGAFISEPDLLLQAKAMLDAPQMTEPVWIAAARALWQTLTNQWYTGFAAACLLECVRTECLPKSK